MKIQTTLIVLSLLLAAQLPAQAKDKKVETKKSVDKDAPDERAVERTLDELIALTLDKGSKRALGKRIAAKLGVERRKPAIALGFGPSKTKNDTAFSFWVLIDETDEEQRVRALVWRGGTIKKEKKGFRLQQISILTSAKGKIRAAVRSKGLSPKIKRTRLAPSSKKVRRAYAQYKEFFLNSPIVTERFKN